MTGLTLGVVLDILNGGSKPFSKGGYGGGDKNFFPFL